MIEYKNLDLMIVGNRDASYTIEAMGPDGERASAPLAWETMSDLPAELEAVQTGVADETTMERVGTALFQALLPMDVLVVYVTARGRLEGNEGLRLRLHLPPELAPLPWELLYYSRHYLATDPSHPIVRFLALPDPPRPLAVRPPLRILPLIAAPTDYPTLRVEQEAALLQEALRSLIAERLVEVMPGRPGTLDTLRGELRHGCHVLHFMGHGMMDGEVGYLVFEDKDGMGLPVNSDTLAHLLRGTGVRLAMLNACESATATGSDAFGSVAAALVQAGLPAVIAHQLPMRDRSAIAFAREFYKALTDGYPVDAAVGEGRKAILSDLGNAWREQMDWAIPVLLMRAPDGRILTLQDGAEEEQGQGEVAPASIHQEIQVEGDAMTVGEVQGGVWNITFGAGPTTAPDSGPAPPSDPLPGLLAELRQKVQDRAPVDKRRPALDKIDALSSGALQSPPDLAVLESVWRWFQSEVPRLSGPVLTAIGSVRPRAEEAGVEVLWDFDERFGLFSD
jgi:hypothetical protein